MIPVRAEVVVEAADRPFWRHLIGFWFYASVFLIGWLLMGAVASAVLGDWSDAVTSVSMLVFVYFACDYENRMKRAEKALRVLGFTAIDRERPS